MSPRTALAAILALVFVLASVCVFGSATYSVVEKQGALAVTGAAANIDRLREFFDVTDHGTTYTILTGRARIQLDTGKFGTTQDLKDNCYVRVVGEQLSARTVLASDVVVVDEKSVGVEISAPQGYQTNDRVEAQGSVTGVQPRYGEIDVRTSTGSFALAVRPETIIRRYIYVTDIGDISEGDDVNFVGTMGRDGRIAVDRVQVSAGSSSQRQTSSASKVYRLTYPGSSSQSREDSIEGVVTNPPSSFDRSLVIDTKFGERKVDVLKTAAVRIDRAPASIHDLTKGDSIRAFGTWDGSTLVASRVETVAASDLNAPIVEEPAAPEPAPTPAPAPEPQPAPTPAAPDNAAATPANPAPDANPAPAAPSAPEAARPNVLTGRIIAIDYTNFDLTLDAGLKDTKIDARDAAITRKGSSRRFSELKKGDKVEVKGDWNADVLKAASVDVVE